MNHSKSLLLALSLACSGYLLLASTVPIAVAEEAGPFISEALYLQWQEDLSNWGRWGPDDELGALNLITPQKRKEAAALVQVGITVSLARNADTVSASNWATIEYCSAWAR